MKKELVKIGIRYNAIYLEKTETQVTSQIKETTANFIANIARLGYTVEETLLHQLNRLNAPQLLAVYEAFVEVLQVKNNWNPLVKGWDIPTNETATDHWITMIVNYFKSEKGERLACGHVIPFNTFPLERYNGCPFCGTPFQLNGEIYTGQGSKMKILKLWTDEQMSEALTNLLTSKTALDVTQVDTLMTLMNHFDLPDVAIEMKETQIIVVDALKTAGKANEAAKLFKTPVDIMRYLWYKHTGFLQIVQPYVIAKRIAANNQHMMLQLSTAQHAMEVSKETLKLKYSRSEAKIVAKWMNDLPVSAEKAAELMHPKRQMWVRFIRALRLAEYSKFNGMEKLKTLLDVFYNENYEVVAGTIEQARLKMDAAKTFALLKERPGLFARSLFANMLWFGKDQTLEAFGEIANQIPARLLLTLNSYASIYFDPSQQRNVKPLGGTNKVIPANPLLQLYTTQQLSEMIAAVEVMCLKSMAERYAALSSEHKTMFIDPNLYSIPLPIGDRATTVQDLPAALMGTRFAIEGNTVRLFMQWGKGLKAQHLDMDLSSQIAFENRVEVCSYYQLQATGAKHSGDIRSIPNEVGTAEYIELNVEELQKNKAKYVSFTCNAYSNGSIAPNLVIGWMNSRYPMAINEQTGVAYDPSCVQHQVRVTQTLSKGMLFGVLDVEKKEIVWMEQSFSGQTVAHLNYENVETMLVKLKAKLTIGKLLAIKAKAQGLILVEDAAQADEVYTSEWALDVAQITTLLVD